MRATAVEPSTGRNTLDLGCIRRELLAAIVEGDGKISPVAYNRISRKLGIEPGGLSSYAAWITMASDKVLQRLEFPTGMRGTLYNAVHALGSNLKGVDSPAFLSALRLLRWGGDASADLRAKVAILELRDFVDDKDNQKAANDTSMRTDPGSNPKKISPATTSQLRLTLLQDWVKLEEGQDISAARKSQIATKLGVESIVQIHGIHARMTSAFCSHLDSRGVEVNHRNIRLLQKLVVSCYLNGFGPREGFSKAQAKLVTQLGFSRTDAHSTVAALLGLLPSN